MVLIMTWVSAGEELALSLYNDDSLALMLSSMPPDTASPVPSDTHNTSHINQHKQCHPQLAYPNCNSIQIVTESFMAI